MKKMVLQLTIEDEKRKRKALKVVAAVEGVDSVAVDMKEKKMTVIGEADPVFVTERLRKYGFDFAQLQSVGPAKDEKKEEKKEEKNLEIPRYVSQDMCTFRGRLIIIVITASPTMRTLTPVPSAEFSNLGFL